MERFLLARREQVSLQATTTSSNKGRQGIGAPKSAAGSAETKGPAATLRCFSCCATWSEPPGSSLSCKNINSDKLYCGSRLSCTEFSPNSTRSFALMAFRFLQKGLWQFQLLLALRMNVSRSPGTPGRPPRRGHNFSSRTTWMRRRIWRITMRPHSRPRNQEEKGTPYVVSPPRLTPPPTSQE